MRWTKNGQPGLGFWDMAAFDPASAIIGSAVIGAGSSLIGSSQAAGSAKDAAKLQASQFQTTRNDLLPYNTAGQSVLNDLTSLAKSGPNGGGTDYVKQASDALPGNMTQAELEATPGYQFALSQGLKSTQAAAAARGLGVSGAALKGAASYATGLADQTYQTQFNNAQTKFSDILGLNTAQQGNVQNQYNRLASTATLGENAAASTGAQGTQAAAAGGNALIAGGQASAAGTAGVGNAITGAANNYTSNALLQQMIGKGQTGGYSTFDTSGVG